MPADADRLLRTWTPRILRGALASSALLLVAGLGVLAWTAPQSYVARYHELKRGGASEAASPSAFFHDLTHGQGHALLVAGLLALTLVPIARVGFAALVFVRERDWLFAVLTAVVLALLGVGVLLGRVG